MSGREGTNLKDPTGNTAEKRAEFRRQQMLERKEKNIKERKKKTAGIKSKQMKRAMFKRHNHIDVEFDQQLQSNHSQMLVRLRQLTTPGNFVEPDPTDDEAMKRAERYLSYVYKTMMATERLGKLIDKLEVGVAAGKYDDIKNFDNVEELAVARKLLEEFDPV